MKKIAHIIALVVLLILFMPQHLLAEEKMVIDKLTVSFFNKGDKAPALPFMDITFFKVNDVETKQILAWQKEINDAIEEFGGVHAKKDYEKVGKVLVEYAERFTNTGATVIDIRFPRERQGFLMKKKKLSVVEA